MGISRYVCLVVGEDPERAARWHAATVRRAKAFALAIHIPVLLWAVSGYLIATRIFGVPIEVAVVVSSGCALLIYLVERLVLATPRAWHVNVARLAIGIVSGLLGASAVDLVVFDREIAQQLRAMGEARESSRFEAQIALAEQVAEKRRSDWLAAEAEAACEANGTCGTGLRSVGRVYIERKRHADVLRAQSDAAYAQVAALKERQAEAIERWRTSPEALTDAGLLARLAALHRYTMDTPAAFVAWSLFFLLVLCLELMVVVVKLIFGETVDDRLEEIREAVARHRGESYREAMTSPVLEARRLLQDAYR